MIINNYFKKKFGKDLSENTNLSNYNWFNLGGNAEYFYKAKNSNQLIEFLKEAQKKELSTTIIVAGSNILIRDGGIKGAIKLDQIFPIQN